MNLANPNATWRRIVEREYRADNPVLCIDELE